MGILFWIGMICAVAGAARLGMAVWNKKRCVGKATGKLVYVEQRYDRTSGSHHQDCYVPYFEFEANGETFCVPSVEDASYDQGSFLLGRTADIQYDPSDPHVCMIDGRSSSTVVGYILFLAGLTLIVLGI